MLRTLLLAASVSLVSVGCGAADPADAPEDTDLVEIDGKADSSVAAPTGPFALESGAAGSFAELVLRVDNNFRRSVLVACFAPPCNPLNVEGRFRAYRSSGSGRTYLKFYSPTGQLLDTYSYLATVRSGDVQTSLSLRQVGGARRQFTMVKYRSSLPQEGETCGGFAGIRCSAGLRCDTPSKMPDQTGICSK